MSAVHVHGVPEHWRPAVVVGGVVLGLVAVVVVADRRHRAAAAQAASPGWLRISQPPEDAQYVAPAAWTPVLPLQSGVPVRDRGYPDRWVPMNGGDDTAWSWAAPPGVGERSAEDTP
jgi:hypothetical protein